MNEDIRGLKTRSARPTMRLMNPRRRLPVDPPKRYNPRDETASRRRRRKRTAQRIRAGALFRHADRLIEMEQRSGDER